MDTENTVGVYSCVYGEEDQMLYRQRRNRELFNDENKQRLEMDPLPSKQLMEEICASSLENLQFTVYSKSEEEQGFNYEIQLLIDTQFISQVEKARDIFKVLETKEYDESIYTDHVYKQYVLEFEELKELLSPLKRSVRIEDETPSDSSQSSYLPSMRYKALIIPFKLEDSWSILWIKFTKLRKFIEIFQYGFHPFNEDKISFRTKLLIKILASYLLGIDIKNEETGHTDLTYKFAYLNFHACETIGTNTAVVQTIRRILKGYQNFGFNVSPYALPSLEDNESNSISRHTRTRNLPLMDINSIREVNETYVKRQLKRPAVSKAAGQEQKRRNVGGRMKLNSRLSLSQNEVSSDSSHILDDSEDVPKIKSSSPPTAKPVKTKEDVKPKKNQQETTTSASNKAESKSSIATLDNLAEVKSELDKNEPEMPHIVQQYKDNYNIVEAQLLDKWARVELFSKAGDATKQTPFSIYGPSQIEFEILREHGMVATNSLKEKIKKYGVTLTTRTMRYLTSSRRWINQRFKLNNKLKYVYYTRDPVMIIPDYNDAPYIVLATHITYGCISSDETFEIIHKTWYISRKMVSFIIGLCPKCHQK